MKGAHDTLLQTFAGAALAGGRSTGRFARRVGQGLGNAYLAVDEDLRRHVAQVPLVGLSTLLAGRQAVRRLPDDGSRPILFLHGFGSGPGVFLPMQLYLRLLGRRRTYALALEESGLERMAARVRSWIGSICRVNGLGPRGKLDVVAHSMGGLVARVALDEPATRKRVHTLITLGTPHAGTHAARYLDTPAARELRPDSEAMARLREQLPWKGPPGMPRLVSFWSEADVLLLPYSSATLEGAENVEMPGFTHLSYLLHPAGFGRVDRALRGT